jgi:glutaminyl-peptide cyclotransferase
LKNANPVSQLGRVVLFAWLTCCGCGKQGSSKPPSIPPLPAAAGETGQVTRYTYELINSWPHDRDAFTQGLVFRNGALLESTGLNGRSSLREIEPKTGRILKQVTVPTIYFAEGLTVIGSQAFQITWQNQKGFVYDADTFQLLKEFSYDGEGWGLTTDGASLILSDGTHRIRFIDPATFAVRRTIDVTLGGKPVDRLNELEFIHGEIFANVWQTDEVVRINPANGEVRGVIDFSGLLPAQERREDTDVLNGIAYDAKGDRLFITGKRWPRVFEVRLRAR